MAYKKTKKRKYKSILIITVLFVLVVIVYLLIFSNPSFWFIKSSHKNASSYSTKHCLVFYPKSSKGKAYAKFLCKENKDDKIFDYSLVPYGDYYFVSYGKGLGYFLDRNFNDVVIENISDDAKKIIVDYLRYTIKKENPEKYYDSKFIASTTVDNVDFNGVTFELYNEALNCYFPNFDLNVEVPLKSIQSELNMNFGYKTETYQKPVFIDNNHPVICLTFDDGPQFAYRPKESSSVAIVDTLYKYDANATFYVVAYELESEDVWTDSEKISFLKRSINNGNEYGSHTNHHEELTDLSTAEKIEEAIYAPAKIMNDFLGYQMLTYRPPGGSFNNNVINAQPMPAILWNVDSEDWLYDNADDIYNNVMDYVDKLEDGDVIIFHDIYDETALALEKIVPGLIDSGYQLVTVKDMLRYAQIDISNLHYYYNLNPYPYYE